jgi:hypothetical protein
LKEEEETELTRGGVSRVGKEVLDLISSSFS